MKYRRGKGEGKEIRKTFKFPPIGAIYELPCNELTNKGIFTNA